MKRMSLYYLHRGGVTTGPFAEGRLRQMWTGGKISAGDMVCEHGTREWIDAGVIAAQGPVETREASPLLAKRVARQPFFLLSLALFAAGVGFALLFPQIIGIPFGAVLIIVALAIDRPRFICGQCGNRVAQTSVMCPACAARLVKRLPKRRGKG